MGFYLIQYFDQFYMTKKYSILIPIQWYPPGFRSGGLAQATQRLVEGLSSHYQIYVLTTNKDFGQDVGYEKVIVDQWISKENGVQIKYLSSKSIKQIKNNIRQINPDFIYLKSLFNPRFSIFPLWMKRTSQIKSKVILAPSGMLKKSALLQKPLKKKFFLFLFKKSGLTSKIKWHATDKQEAMDIKRFLGGNRFDSVLMLPEFPPKPNRNVLPIKKTPGAISLCFISRIHNVKNLLFILECLKTVRAKVRFTIGGPIEEKAYWETCKRVIKELPENIEVEYIGEVKHLEVATRIQESHLLVLPSKGEGFGNIILEALMVARPVLISDQTPWGNLSKHKAGWNLPLNKPQAFVDAINKMTLMDQEEYDEWSKGALQYAQSQIDIRQLKEKYSLLFS